MRFWKQHHSEFREEVHIQKTHLPGLRSGCVVTCSLQIEVCVCQLLQAWPRRANRDVELMRARTKGVSQIPKIQRSCKEALHRFSTASTLDPSRAQGVHRGVKTDGARVVGGDVG